MYFQIFKTFSINVALKYLKCISIINIKKNNTFNRNLGNSTIILVKWLVNVNTYHVGKI